MRISRARVPRPAQPPALPKRSTPRYRWRASAVVPDYYRPSRVGHRAAKTRGYRAPHDQPAQPRHSDQQTTIPARDNADSPPPSADRPPAARRRAQPDVLQSPLPIDRSDNTHTNTPLAEPRARQVASLPRSAAPAQTAPPPRDERATPPPAAPPHRHTPAPLGDPRQPRHDTPAYPAHHHRVRRLGARRGHAYARNWRVAGAARSRLLAVRVRGEREMLPHPTGVSLAQGIHPPPPHPRQQRQPAAKARTAARSPRQHPAPPGQAPISVRHARVRHHAQSAGSRHHPRPIPRSQRTDSLQFVGTTRQDQAHYHRPRSAQPAPTTPAGLGAERWRRSPRSPSTIRRGCVGPTSSSRYVAIKSARVAPIRRPRKRRRSSVAASAQ